MASSRKPLFATDYAKSNRATCQTCKEDINQGLLRMSRRVPSAKFDGLQDQWHHFPCFFKEKKGFDLHDPKDVEGLEMLRPADQDKVKKAIAEANKKSPTAQTSTAKSNVANKRPSDCPPLRMEHAKSSRSKCRKCLQPVQEGELRLAYEREPDEKPWFPAPVPHWFHTKCFLQDLEHVLQDREGIPLAGINTEWFDGEAEPEVLEKLDKDFDNLRAKHGLPKLAEAKSKAAKGKREGKSEQIDGGASAPASKRGKSQKKEQAEEQQQRSSATGKKDSSRDAALKRQSEELQDLHKKLGNCTLDELRSMLDANGINPRGKGETLVNRAAEGMLFGVLENCKRCGENAWDYEQDGYHCNGNVSGWEPCGVITQSPPVKEWKVPDDVKTIKQKKFKPKKRVFPLPEGATREMSAVSEGAGEKNTRRKDDDDDEDDSGGRKRASKSKSKKGSKAWTPESTKATTRSSTRSAPPTRSSSPGNSGRKRAAGGHVRAAFVDTLAVAIQRKLPDADLMSALCKPRPLSSYAILCASS